MARKLNYQEFEGDMAKSQLQKIEMYAKKLNEMINPEDELEGWVQSKLSRISTDIGDIKHYLDYELKKMGHGGTTHIATLQPYLVMAKTDLDNDDVKSFKVYADDDEHAVEITEYMYKPYYDDFEVIKVQKFAEGGMVSTSKMQQAKKLLGESLWERFREDEKENVTIYLMNKGLIDIDDDDDDDDDYDDDELMGMQDVPEDRTMWEYGYKRGGKVDESSDKKSSKMMGNGGEIEVGDSVIVKLNNGKTIQGKIEKLNPYKIRISPSDTMVIPNSLLLSIKKMADGGMAKGAYIGKGGLALNNMDLEIIKKIDDPDYLVVYYDDVLKSWTWSGYGKMKSGFKTKEQAERSAADYENYR